MEINHLKDEYADAYENTFHAKRVKKEKEMELALKNMQTKVEVREKEMAQIQK